MSTGTCVRGIGVSPGIGVGRAVVARWELPEVPNKNVGPQEIRNEVRRLRAAVRDVTRQLESLREQTEHRGGPNAARIFEAQLLMLQDHVFLRGVDDLIKENRLTAEKAYEFKALEMGDVWGKAGSARLRERVSDLMSVTIWVVEHLMRRHRQDDFWLTLEADGPFILVSKELSPGMIVQLDIRRVVGLVSEEGTRTSHAAILAHSLSIPAVMGVKNAVELLSGDQMVVIDGNLGTVICDATDADIDAARTIGERREAHSRELAKALGRPSVTADGVPVTIRANVDLPDELEEALRNEARGVGLVRTEFLVTSRSQLPTESEQAEYFLRLVGAFPNDPVVIRTFDLGGDKFPALRSLPERNPFLGWRAIRVCLDNPEIFRPQIRAALRAAQNGTVHLMLPLITGVEEVEQARALVDDEASALAKAGIPAPASIPVGVMVETPAAVEVIDQLAEVSDFLSVGTNDLTQYTLVVDRSNARLAPRFLPHHPSVLRSLSRVAAVALERGVPLSVCGEMASHPLGAFLLVGLGYTTLSVTPPAIPLVRAIVQQISAAGARDLVAEALGARSAAEVKRLTKNRILEFVEPSLLEPVT